MVQRPGLGDLGRVHHGPSALSRGQRETLWGQKDATPRESELSSYVSCIFQTKICDMQSEKET